MAEINEIISQKAIDGIITGDKAISKFDETLIKFLKSIEQTNTVLAKVPATTENIAKAQKQTNEVEKEAIKIKKEQDSAAKALDSQRNKGLAVLAKQETKEREMTAAINKEVKSIQDLKNQTSALIAKRNQLDQTTKKGTEEYKKLTTQIGKNQTQLKKYDAEIGNHQRNVGNYGSALKGVGTKLLGFASAIGIGIGAMEAFKSIISSTDAIGDVFARNIEGLKQSFGFLARAIANTDFTNLIQGMKDAFEEGKRYADVLDEIEDRQRSLGIITKTIEGQIIDQRVIAKNRQLDLKDREAAIKEIIRLEKLKLDETKEITETAIDNELQNAAQISKLREDEIQDFVSNYKKYSDRIQEGFAIQEKLNSLVTTTQAASGFVVTDYYKRDEALKNLTESEKESLRLAELSSKIVPEQRNRIAAAIEKNIDAENELKRSGEELVMLENRLIKEFLREEKAIEKSTEQKNKSAKEITKINEEMNADLLAGDKAWFDEEMNLIDAENKANKEAKDAKVTATKEANDIILQNSIETADAIAEKEKQAADDAIKLAQEKADKTRAILQGSVDVFAALGQLELDQQQNRINEETTSLAAQKEWELGLAKGNKEKEDSINQKYAIKEKALKQEQAKQTKKQASFNAAINFAGALIAALTIPPPASFIAEAFTAALAGVQLAAILSTPVPQFKGGTKGRFNSPKAFIAGEANRELIEKNGKMMMVDKPTMITGLEGARIYSNKETERLMQGRDRIGVNLQPLLASNDRIVKTIQNKTEWHYSAEKRELTARKGDYWQKYKNVKLH